MSLEVGDKITVAWRPERGQWCKARVTHVFVSGFRFQDDGYAGSKTWNPYTKHAPMSFDLEGVVWVRGWIEDGSPEAAAMRVAHALGAA